MGHTAIKILCMCCKTIGYVAWIYTWQTRAKYLPCVNETICFENLI